MALISNISPKYQDIISKSLLFSSGSPHVYHLQPKKETFGNLTRMTVGEKKVGKINKTIIFVGETGAGKSSLINALTNYAMGVKWEDNLRFELIKEENRAKIKSQTLDVIVYEIFGFEDETLPFSLTLIDTPGFGDTEEAEKNDLISQRLCHLLQSEYGVHEADAVALVLQDGTNRLHDRMQYIFNSMMSLFGKDMEENIVALITHSSGVTAKNVIQALEAANVKCAKNDKNQPLNFLFNNLNDDRTEYEDELKSAHEKSVRGMREFTGFLGKKQPRRLEATREVLKERIRMTACIQNLKERIKLSEQKQTEITQIKEALKKHQQEMKNNDFTIEVDESYKEKVIFDCSGKWALGFFNDGAVCCTSCEENCHYPGCTKAKSADQCDVMKGGRCTICTHKCPASAHVKDNWTFVTKTRKALKTNKDLEMKYEMEAKNKLSLLENLDKEMDDLRERWVNMLKEAHDHVVRLDQIALNGLSLSTHVHLDFLIEKMKETGDTEKVKKLEEMKSQQDKGYLGALRYSEVK